MKLKNRKKRETISFTEGNISLALLRFSLPVLGALVLQAAYGAVDLLVIGMFSDAAGISAVGTGSTFLSMVTFVITSLAMGSTVTIGRHIGEKRPEKAGETVGTTILLFAVLSVLLTIFCEVFTPQITAILQVPAEAVGKTMEYLRICFAGIVVISAYNVISAVLRGAGNANLPLLFVGIACVANIIGDFVLIGVFHLDVAGAALATVGAQLISVIASLFVLKKQSTGISFTRKQLRFYRKELVSILKIGIPIAVQELTVQISFLVINSIINGMGLMPSAGYGVAQKIITFIMLVPSAIMQSVSAFVAQNIGAGQKQRAFKGMLTAMGVGSIAGLVMFGIGFFQGSAISSVFTPDPEVIAQSAAYLRGFSADCLLTCILFSCIGYFNGCGISLPVMLQGMISALCIRIPISLALSQVPNASLSHVGLAAPISTVFGIVFFAVCFLLLSRRRKYRKDFPAHI